MKLRHLCSLAVLAGWSGVDSRAADETPGARRSDVTEESAIADAKKSFDSLKQKRTADGRGLELPRVSTPELNLSGPSVAPLPKKKAPEKASKGWLVDGVMGQATDPAKAGSGVDSVAGELERSSEQGEAAATKRGDPGSNLRERLGERAVDRPGERPDHPPRTAAAELVPVAAPNPLAGFMSSWISSQDRSLLLPATPRSAGGVERPGGAFDAAAVMPGTAGSSGIGAAPAANVFKPLPQENPYLSIAGLRAPEGGAGPAMLAKPEVRYVVVKLPEVALPGGRDSRDPAPPEKPLPRGRPGADDESKYFKQLKRF